jgi:outer membrane protein OmpA-like peptidoglycan-associated protein
MGRRVKMPKTSQDDVKTRLWSISFLSSVSGGVPRAKGAGGAMAVFDLFNRETGRAHTMLVSAGGKASGLPVGASFRDSGYIKFTTTKPASFPDFHDTRAKLVMKDRIAKSWRTLTVYQSLTSLEKLMNVKVNNWNPTGWQKFQGHGISKIYYSDGKPIGDPDLEPRVDVPTNEVPDDRFQVKENDLGYVIRLPSKVLFDWDKDTLHYEAEEHLSDAMTFINRLPDHFHRIEVEGHTDSTEKRPGYNMDLSMRRARTVLNYMVRNKWAFDRDYEFGAARGLGATKPIAPNSNADGSDNRAGREQNRRVEIYVNRRR